MTRPTKQTSQINDKIFQTLMPSSKRFVITKKLRYCFKLIENPYQTKIHPLRIVETRCTQKFTQDAPT